jgi:hypothetical protein
LTPALHGHEDYGTSDATYLHAVQYYFDRSTSRSYGEGHVEEEGGKVNGNYNACLTQNANVILTELRYLLSYQ